jgi:hypothetical protein
MKKNQTIILSVFAIIILSIVGWYSTRPQGSLEFALAPQELTIAIDDKKQVITHRQTINLTPGNYETTFSATGFRSETKTITVENHKKLRVVMALTPLTDSAKKILSDNPESQNIVKEYEQVKYQELLASLPISGVGYIIGSCPSIKQPKSEAKALCIEAENPPAEAAARKSLQELGYNQASLEILTGTKNIRTVRATDTYRIDYYTNTTPEGGTGKTALFVTPLNTPFIPATTAYDAQLEDIRKTVLSDLSANNYDLSKYDIFYSNFYLSKYSPGNDAPAEHAFPPSYQ